MAKSKSAKHTGHPINVNVYLPRTHKYRVVHQVCNNILSISIYFIAHMTSIGLGCIGSRQKGEGQSSMGAQPSNSINKRLSLNWQTSLFNIYISDLRMTMWQVVASSEPSTLAQSSPGWDTANSCWLTYTARREVMSDSLSWKERSCSIDLMRIHGILRQY